MNAPLFAGILILSAFACVGWFAWVGIGKPSSTKAGLSLVGGALLLFYAGGWAAGYDFVEITSTLLLLLFFGFLGWLKTEAQFWGAELGSRFRQRSRLDDEERK